MPPSLVPKVIELVKHSEETDKICLLYTSIQEQLDSRITFGQKVADEVARFGGSWTFISVSYTHLDVYKRQVLDDGC